MPLVFGYFGNSSCCVLIVRWTFGSIAGKDPKYVSGLIFLTKTSVLLVCQVFVF